MIALSIKAAPKRAASFFLIGALLLPTLIWAHPHQKNRETYSDIIQKAQNLILQKNRPQALNVLIIAIKNERPSSLGFKELRKSLSEISRVFISEKSQQAYELSLSLKRTDLNLALTKIVEALRFEPENFTLLLENARQNITKGDCKAALEITQKTQKLNPWDEELNLVIAQTKMCLNDNSGYAMAKEGMISANSLPWISLEIEKNIKEKNFNKAKDGVSQLKKIDKNYPERLYWAWRIDSEQKINNLEAAQEYKTECQNLTVLYYRRFILDPRLCSRTADIDAFIKSQPQSP